MRKQRHTPEQIIRKLRKAEVELTKGQFAAEVARRSSNITHECHPPRGLSPTRPGLQRSKACGGLRLGAGPFARKPGSEGWGRGGGRPSLDCRKVENFNTESAGDNCFRFLNLLLIY